MTRSLTERSLARVTRMRLLVVLVSALPAAAGFLLLDPAVNLLGPGAQAFAAG